MQTLLIPERALERLGVVSVRSWDATLNQGVEHRSTRWKANRRSTGGLRILGHAPQSPARYALA